MNRWRWKFAGFRHRLLKAWDIVTMKTRPLLIIYGQPTRASVMYGDGNQYFPIDVPKGATLAVYFSPKPTKP